MASRAQSPRWWQRGPWKFAGGAPFPRGWTFGLVTPGYKLLSSAYLPGSKARRAIGSNRIPFWHVVNYTLAALASGDDRILPTNHFILLSIMATMSQGNGFQTQFFQVADDKGTGFRFSNVGVIFDEITGTAEAPYIMRRPYPMQDLLPLANRVANRATAANTVQLVLYGLKQYATGDL
jgi:hypothetical protein